MGSQRGIEIRSWPELVSVSKLPTELVHIHDLSFSPDGKTLLAAGGSPAEAGVVEVLSWPDKKLVRRIASHKDLVYRIAWSPDGTQWATAGADGICQVFSFSSGERLAQYEGHSRAVLSLCFLDDGKTVASCGVDQTLQLWEAATGKHLRTLDNHVGTVNDVVLRPSDKADSPPIVATISEDRTVRLWQPTIGRLMRFARLPSTPRVVHWSASGDRLLVGCNDGRVRTLDADSLEVTADSPMIEGRILELLLDDTNSRIFAAGESGLQRSGEAP